MLIGDGGDADKSCVCDKMKNDKALQASVKMELLGGKHACAISEAMDAIKVVEGWCEW